MVKSDVRVGLLHTVGKDTEGNLVTKCISLLRPPQQNTADWGGRNFWRLEVQVQGVDRVGSLETSLLGLYISAFSVCLHVVFALCTHSWCLCISKFPLIRTTVRLHRAYPTGLILT